MVAWRQLRVVTDHKRGDSKGGIRDDEEAVDCDPAGLVLRRNKHEWTWRKLSSGASETENELKTLQKELNKEQYMERSYIGLYIHKTVS